jgi:ATP-dependent DNA ligase
MVNHVDLRDTSLEARRMMLSNTVTHLGSPTLQQTPVSADGATMWAFVQEHKIEGLIAKATGSKYRSRRDDAWLKIKDTKRLTAILLDYEPGEEDSKRRGMVGALKLYLLDKSGKPVEIGKCGTGFSDAEATDLRVRLDAYATGVATSPTDPPAPLLGEIEYQEVTKDMRLRFPSWRGLRFDIDITECTTAQIGV